MPRVEGVLECSPGGVNRWDEWFLVLHLMPWRRGKELAVWPLRIEVPMKQAAIDAAMSSLTRGDAVRVTVGEIRRRPKLEEWEAAGKPPKQIALEGALAEAARARAVPVTIKSDVFGRMTLDRSLGWFEGKTRLWDRRIAVSVRQTGNAENRERDERDIERAEADLRRIVRARRTIEQAIVRELLSLYNDTWRERGAVLTGPRFLARLRPDALAMYPGGGAQLYYKDGGLFLNHLVEVRLTKTGRVSEVGLAG